MLAGWPRDGDHLRSAEGARWTSPRVSACRFGPSPQRNSGLPSIGACSCLHRAHGSKDMRLQQSRNRRGSVRSCRGRTAMIWLPSHLSRLRCLNRLLSISPPFNRGRTLNSHSGNDQDRSAGPKGCTLHNYLTLARIDGIVRGCAGIFARGQFPAMRGGSGRADEELFERLPRPINKAVD